MAERTEIAGEINALAVHCRPPIMEVEQRASWLRDWCSDLAEFDIEAIRGACREWRHSGASKFPTPGQLLPLIRKRDTGDIKGATKYEPWRPLSDAEYEALPLSAKVRHQRILAHEARCKAGPMWKNQPGSSMRNALPGHVPAEEMSPTYRKWHDIADGHDAEAKRLSEYLRRTPLAAE